MFMVCMLHTLGNGGILSGSEPGTAGYRTYWLMETFAYCAVDGFALISGYTARNRPQKYVRIVNMWFQAFFYSFLLTVILTVVGLNANHSASFFIRNALPVTYDAFWYFTAYVPLFFVIPLLNAYLFSIDEGTAKKALIVAVALFSVLCIRTDPFKSAGGYSALWLAVLYVIGVLANRIELFRKRKSSTLILLFLLSSLLSWGLFAFWGRNLLISYISPTILLNGLILVVLFSRLNLDGHLLRKVSPLAFGIYLFQCNRVLWGIMNDSFSFVTALPVWLGVLCALGLACAIFVMGLLCEAIRVAVFRATRMEQLSETIVRTAERLIAKCEVLLR